jgi:phospholipid/cholesterol/gamma-HCH transport system permease protein
MIAGTATSVNVFVVTSSVPDTVTLTISGDWSIRHGLPSLAELGRVLRPPATVRRVILKAKELGRWDSALMTFLFGVATLCRERGVAAEMDSLPPDVRRLIELATAIPRHDDSAASEPRPILLARIGAATLRKRALLRNIIAFLGQSVIAFARLLRGRARYRRADLVLAIEECGAQALPIVSIISLLVGMIFAFVGAIQLEQFDAGIYDADLVAVAMTREMAAVMTAVVLAGRTGAAFAAQIGSMQENEEIDALSTLDLSPIEFLVLPRMLALTLMTPLLCIYAIALGILGGVLVAANVLDVTTTAYLVQTQHAVQFSDLAISIVKAAVFGWLVAVTGCFCGIHSGRSAAAVGAAATSAVVYGILAIIVADAVFAVLLNILGL